MLTALARSGSFDTSQLIAEPLTVFTQRAHVFDADAIRLDLVLFWPRLALEIWIEVKTGAALSGLDQLDRYAAAQIDLTSMDGLIRPSLVLLSEVDLKFTARSPGTDVIVASAPTHMAWQDILEAVRDVLHPDTLWLELVSFLKEKGMTQDATFPISARESTSLSDSHHLYLKSVT